MWNCTCSDVSEVCVGIEKAIWWRRPGAASNRCGRSVMSGHTAERDDGHMFSSALERDREFDADASFAFYECLRLGARRVPWPA
jgi:hypothetical protein